MAQHRPISTLPLIRAPSFTPVLAPIQTLLDVWICTSRPRPAWSTRNRLPASSMYRRLNAPMRTLLPCVMFPVPTISTCMPQWRAGKRSLLTIQPMAGTNFPAMPIRRAAKAAAEPGRGAAVFNGNVNAKPEPRASRECRAALQEHAPPSPAPAFRPALPGREYPAH
jgi:hypothetical protein